MDEYQEMERFGLENDYEDGQWIGGEFYGKRRRKRAPQTKDDVLFGVFASSSDSDSDSKQKRKRAKVQSKNIDLSKPVNFVSSMPSQDSKPTRDENALKDDDFLLLPTALGKKIQQGVNKRKKEKEKEKLIMKRKEPDCNSVVGEFEKHTKGIGLKLLEKFGYKKGDGLGKNQQGIVAPIEINLRPKNEGMGFNHYKKLAVEPDEEKPAAPRSTQTTEVRPSWSKRAVKKKKPVYELLTPKQERVIEKIIDRRGPQVRVLTNMENLNLEEEKNDDPMPELQYNIGLIVNSAKREKQERDEDLSKEKDKYVALQMEKEKLQNDERRQNQQLKSMEDIASVVDRIDELISSSGGSLTLESLAMSFEDLQTRYPEEYTMCKLSYIACSYALPLFVSYFQWWDPLENPTHGVEVVSNWKTLLQTSSYRQLLVEVVFPAVRKCANSWSVRDDPERMVRFVESWEKILPPALLQAILDTVIMPKIKAAVDSWDPCRETKPIDKWVHPWLLYLGQQLEKNCYHTICDKLSCVLHAWHPSDMSVFETLDPWKTLFDPASWEKLMVKHIIPKLKTVMQQLQINPADQKLDQFFWVTTWVEAIPTHYMLRLMDTFFDKWQLVLYHWLCSKPKLDEVTEWFVGWKEQLPLELQANERIRNRLFIGLCMMKQAAEGKEVPQPGLRGLPEQKQSETKRKKATDKPKEVLSDDHISFKEVIEFFAQDNGLLFKPKPGMMKDGHQIFGFGNVSIFVDWLKQKVFAHIEERWLPVSLDQLLGLHNRSTLKRH